MEKMNEIQSQNKEILKQEEQKQNSLAYKMNPGPNLQSTNPENAFKGYDNNVVTIEIQKLEPVPKEYFEQSIFYQKYPYFEYNQGGSDYIIRNKFTNDSFNKVFSNISSDHSLCHSLTNNGFFDAFYLAYALHGEVTISPDDVWMAIVLPFAHYVDKNAEKLRDKLVTFEKKKKLSINIFNSQNPVHTYKDCLKPDFRWDQVFENFSKLIEQNSLPGIAELIQCNFSTTGQVEKALSQVSLMQAMQKFFDYEMMICGCGIQKVHMLGTLNDWQQLLNKLPLLMKYAPEKWVLELEKIILQFIQTYQNKPDLKFWNAIINKEEYQKRYGPSGMRQKKSYQISGWIMIFYSLSAYGFEQQTIDIEEIPNYQISGVPCKLICEQTGFEADIKFGGGFTGVIKKDNNYRPQQSINIDLGELQNEQNE